MRRGPGNCWITARFDIAVSGLGSTSIVGIVEIKQVKFVTYASSTTCSGTSNGTMAGRRPGEGTDYRDQPSRVAEDAAFRNAQRNSDRENTRIEHDKALLRVMIAVMKDDTELFKQYMDDAGFKRWMADTVFELLMAHAPSA